MTQEELGQIMPRLRSGAVATAERFFGRGEEQAEDVAQECCLRLWLRCADLRSGEVEALAHTIARNLCVSEQRRPSHATLMPDISHERTPAASAIDSDNRRLLHAAILSLPPAWQRLLRMQSETGMTTRQMAVVLGIKPESVSAMLSAARRRLFDMLKNHLQH